MADKTRLITADTEFKAGENLTAGDAVYGTRTDGAPEIVLRKVVPFRDPPIGIVRIDFAEGDRIPFLQIAGMI